MISRFSLALSLITILFLITGCLTSSDSTEPAGNTKNDEFAPTARAFEFETRSQPANLPPNAF